MGKGGWRFRVEIDGIPDTPILGVTGLGSEVEVMAKRDPSNPSFNGWPIRYQGPELHAGATEVPVQSIEIAHEGLELA